MLSQSFEAELLQNLLNLAVLLLIGLFTITGVYLKKLIDKHLDVKDATLFNSVVDGLSQLADATVQQFNQEVVTSEKTNHTFTSETAKLVKQNAVKAVLSQGSTLASLLKSRLPDIETLVGTLIEQSVVKSKSKQ